MFPVLKYYSFYLCSENFEKLLFHLKINYISLSLHSCIKIGTVSIFEKKIGFEFIILICFSDKSNIVFVIFFL